MLPSLAAHRRESARWQDVLLICLIGAILFLPFLGLRDIWSAGEGRVAQVARQMIDSGDWVTPRLGNNVRMKKPPMAYWLTAIASLPGGEVTAFSSRLPNALAGIGVMLLVYLFGLAWFSRSTAILAAILFGTTSECWQQARTTGIEIPLLFFSLLGFYCWWRYHSSGDFSEDSSAAVAPGQTTRNRVRPLGWLLACYAAFALSALEKAHVGPVLFMVIAALFVTLTKSWRRTTLWQFLTHHAMGLALLLLIALPWVVLVLQAVATGSGSVTEAVQTWRRESGGRLRGFDHLEPWYYFLRIAVLEGQPWVLFGLLGFSLPLGLSKRRQRGMILLTLWVSVTLLYFSIPGSKKSYYILPMYPALALLAAHFLRTFARRDLSLRMARFTRLVFLFSGSVPIVIAIIFWPVWWFFLQNHPKLHVLSESLGLIAAILFLLAGIGVLLFTYARRRMFHRATICLILLTVTVYAGILASYPQQNRHKDKRIICLHLTPQLRDDDRVFTYEVSGTSIFAFYLNHPVERLVETHDIGSQLIYRKINADTTRVFILMREKEIKFLRNPAERTLLLPLDHPPGNQRYRWYQYQAKESP